MQPIVEITTVVVYTVYLVSMSGRLFVLAVAALPVVALIAPRINRRISDASKRFTSDLSRYGGDLQESLSASFEVQVHATYRFESEKVDHRQDEVVRTWLEIVRSGALLTLMSDVARGLGPVLVYAYGAFLATKGEMQVGQIVAFAAVLGGLYGALDKLIKYPPLLRTSQDRFDELMEWFDAPKVFVDGPGARATDAPAVALDDVSFSYGPAKPAVVDLSLAVAAGERVAFVGPSGCGKSTVLKPDRGSAAAEQGSRAGGGSAARRAPRGGAREHRRLRRPDALPLRHDRAREPALRPFSRPAGPTGGAAQLRRGPARRRGVARRLRARRVLRRPLRPRVAGPRAGREGLRRARRASVDRRRARRRSRGRAIRSRSIPDARDRRREPALRARRRRSARARIRGGARRGRRSPGCRGPRRCAGRPRLPATPRGRDTRAARADGDQLRGRRGARPRGGTCPRARAHAVRPR
ncbi:MAG: ATP-binding cassette domain-containing protein [Deltaproteobacteria bacterium]|nr:ATP-binding cassette domain-containing protein [Deltaproteobacteria bacterium]